MRGVVEAAQQPAALGGGDHFIDVVLGGGKQKCSANFDYAGPLTESVIIGNVAARVPGETLKFDARSLEFPGKPEANQYLSRTYRNRWKPKD